MNFIIDTQVLIWMEESPQKISKPAQEIIYSDEPIYVSAASVLEIVIKRAINKLTVSKSTEGFISSFLSDYSASLLNISIKDILLVEKLPMVHKDPFDRMLAAQSQNLNIPIISADRIFDEYPVKRLW